MTEIEARVADLINFSSGQKPIEFEDMFKRVMQDRVATAIDNKKIEMASKMFSGQEVDADEAEDETDEDQETEEDIEVEDQEDGEIA